MKRILQTVKLIPLLLLGATVIIWGMVFQRSLKDDEGQSVFPSSGQDDSGPIFPY